MVRGRSDPQYFCHYFLGEKLHDGQLDFMLNAEASINVLASGNRWGKTFLQGARHYWRGFYKLGAEWRYLDPVTGEVDVDKYLDLKYQTMHCAQGWDTAAMVWDTAYAWADRPQMRPFVKSKPRSAPPYILFQNGWRWLFRTLGDKGQGVDGTSLYLVSIDEAGWIENLEWILNNVVRIRIADVQGMVDIIGTFKPGISRQFFTYAKLASVSTGINIEFDFTEWQAALKDRGFDEQLPVGREDSGRAGALDEGVSVATWSAYS